MRWTISLILTLLTLATVSPAIGADGDTTANRRGIEFFEKKIRPVLVKHCYECHAADAKNVQGGLLLDSRDGLLTGGDSGAALVPGKPEESLLISALKFDGFEMPPKGKLPANMIADFEQWIRMGAPDPRTQATSTKAKVIDIEAGRAHWAYQLPVRPPLPAVKATDWPREDIDRFILARLEKEGLQPGDDADRAALVRRLYFDLIGLPPTPEQIDAFVNDRSPDPYERLVDELLASPHYGERWGRHWLDIVRFAESVTLRGFIFKEAWRYRDYVIESFNADVPFDRFLVEQLAGDLLNDTEFEARSRSLTATTFLMMGNSNLEDQDKSQLEMDYIDEQLDVIGRGLLAQTLTCARCHDHKFDPIPTRDYYAMAGILKNVVALDHANISVWKKVPLPVRGELKEQLDAHDKAVAALEAKAATLKQTIQFAEKGSAESSGNIVAVNDLPGIVVDDTQARKVGDWMNSQFHKSYVGTGYTHDKNEGKGAKTLTFLPKLPADGKYEVRFAYTPSSNRSTAVPVTVFSAEGEKTIKVNEQQTPDIDGKFVSLGQYRFEVDGQCFVIVSNEETQGHVIADAMQFIPVDQLDSLKVADKPEAEETAKSEATTDIARTKKDLAKVEADLKKLRANGPNRPMTMSVIERKEVNDLPIHIRGNVQNLGDVVPRGVLQVATYGTAPQMPADQSGRLQLAEWIASPQNPLTARVIVNRTWHWLFGTGIVRTVDNFGTTGELPSHPQLLDYLTTRFVEEGWSMKWLVREIVLSRTYHLSTAVNDRASAVDPENRLLSRMNPRRLDAECLRDAMLSISGQLKLDAGGPSFPDDLSSDYTFQDTDTRRSVYVPVFRNSLPDIFEVFDFANPSMVSGKRTVSTVAPQALYLMNHPFVREQAHQAAMRTLGETEDDNHARINEAYRRTLGRLPTEAELQLSNTFLQNGQGDEEKASKLEAWTQLYQALFSSIEFRYLR